MSASWSPPNMLISSSLTIHDDAPTITPPATTGTIPDFVVTEQGGINGAASHNFSSNFSTGNSNAVDQNASLTTSFSFSLNFLVFSSSPLYVSRSVLGSAWKSVETSGSTCKCLGVPCIFCMCSFFVFSGLLINCIS